MVDFVRALTKYQSHILFLSIKFEVYLQCKLNLMHFIWSLATYTTNLLKHWAYAVSMPCYEEQKQWVS